ncbi:MAG: class II aldolase/adducin family protein [Christensenellaceae bacterium]|nr:class II aldolase/adducin family protein [Christensenellaceae bacterium]
MLVRETAENAAEVLADVARRMYQSGMVSAYEGNISVRIGDRVLITPSGICKGLLDPDMLVEVDLEGRQTKENGIFRASTETRLHTAIYQKRPEIRSVCHTHAPFSTAFAVLNQPITSNAYPEARTLYDEIPVAKYGRPNTDDIWQDVMRLIPENNILLLANHGPVSVGTTIWDAYLRMESCESIAKVLYYARQMGKEADLPAEEIEALQALYHRKFAPNVNP